ncbi:hypothetical protein QBC34DRAFT_100954 [Podospora aff. communis PSN243]|uniref:Ankyrin repeat protein n=1 Tax=Podospora aff. communis PSN243 TaxID=3040156 RepID=A0AAV9GK59_9PEZI|nr:hypothetical protein QBC34DRAFT_100954 [Podospora aff. communis PSN243]
MDALEPVNNCRSFVNLPDELILRIAELLYDGAWPADLVPELSLYAPDPKAIRRSARRQGKEEQDSFDRRREANKAAARLARTCKKIGRAATEVLWKFDSELDPRSGGSSGLAWAARLGDVSLARYARHCGASLGSAFNLKTGQMATPLHYAAKFGHDEMVEFLLDQGADLYAPGNICQFSDCFQVWSETLAWAPLHEAIQGGHLSTVKLLGSKYAKNTCWQVSARIPGKPRDEQPPVINAIHNAVVKGDGAILVYMIHTFGPELFMEPAPDYEFYFAGHFDVENALCMAGDRTLLFRLNRCLMTALTRIYKNDPQRFDLLVCDYLSAAYYSVSYTYRYCLATAFL